jgi:enoyl-CoA hydratase/carnithine racemase
MTSTVLSTLTNGVRTITLNRPERLNAMNRTLVSEVLAAFSEANADPETRAVIFRGAGGAFCSGDDLKEHVESKEQGEREVRAFCEEIQDITREIVLGEKMVVGAIHGWAVGGGLEWAIDCDLPIFAENTRCFFPEVYWGVFVTGGVTTILPKIVGLTRAKELILFGEKFDARQALEMGLAWRLVPEDELFTEAEAVAGRIAELPAGAVRDLKRVINRACYLDLEGALLLETEAAVRGLTDPEATERIREFTG